MLRPVDHELLCVVGALYDGLERYGPQAAAANGYVLADQERSTEARILLLARRRVALTGVAQLAQCSTPARVERSR